jgi:tetratricopeptide (TPR) repeat protein
VDGLRLVLAALLLQAESRLMESRRHMLEGISLLERGNWLPALHHFEKAIEIREATAWRESVESAWLLAAAWINRSDVLRHLSRTEDGVASLDRAIDAMNFVPLDENPGYANRLILAWINRGTACGEIGRPDEALAGFATAETMLAGANSAERKLLASMLHANRARVLLDGLQAAAGWADSLAAVDFLRELEPLPVVTEAAIKARGIRCRALAMLLDEPDGSRVESDWIAAATDSVEEALFLVRSTGYRGAWVADLVRYGARIYRICQPHFLGEYIREWLGADGPLSQDDALRREMAGELILAEAELEQRVLGNTHETELIARAIETLRSLQQARGELAG